MKILYFYTLSMPSLVEFAQNILLKPPSPYYMECKTRDVGMSHSFFFFTPSCSWNCIATFSSITSHSGPTYSLTRIPYIHEYPAHIFFRNLAKKNWGARIIWNRVGTAPPPNKMIPSRVKEWSVNHVLSGLWVQDLDIARSRQRKSLG